MYRPLALLVAFCLYLAGVWAVATTQWTDASAAAVPTAAGTPSRPVPTAPKTLSPTAAPVPGGVPAVWTLGTLRDHLVAETKAANPGVALADLARITRADPYVDGFCHPVAHEIGRTALDMYHGDFNRAVSYFNDVCGSGYLHGVVEDKLLESPNPATAVTTLCAPAQTGSCIHGIGHGTMFVTHLDIPAAERMCDRFPLNSQRVNCSEGLFMQLFEPDVTDAAALAKLPTARLAAEPLYPCPDQPWLYQSACYFYAPSYFLTTHDYTHHPEAFVQALAWCLRAPSDDGATDCTRGTGSRLMKYNIDRPVWTAAQCEQASPAQREPCVDGMVSYWNVNYGTRSAGAKLCPQLTGEARRLCSRAPGATASID